MPATTTDGSSSLDSIYDGLHGYIALDDFGVSADGQIRRLLGAPYLQRLRRVKQLGYVSQNFLSAEHNRYAHALGTMQMMRDIITCLNQKYDFWKEILEDVQRTFKFLEDIGQFANKRDALHQHLLVAALIQDVGEYPYAKATEFFFTPEIRVKQFLTGEFSFDVEEMTHKELMTLAVVFTSADVHYIDGLDPQFLAFLLCGKLADGRSPSVGLRILRHMLDGSVDADRMDYVYRDAYHTLGERGVAATLIDSLVTYDESGPVFKHVRPVMDFLSKRALLWSTVYHGPENRFRIILLRTIFKEFSRQPSLTTDLGNEIFQEPLFPKNEVNFIHFDDRSVEKIIEALSSRDPDIHPNASKAIKLLSAGSSEYEYKWVRLDMNQEFDLNAENQLPNFFYYDLYSDYSGHSLYDEKSIRLRGSRYEADGGTIELEKCVGPFSAALRAPWPSLPMPGHMAWFEPTDDHAKTNQRWQRLSRYRQNSDHSDPALVGQLMRFDPMIDGEIVFDTREHPNCEGPAIFLSFRSVDYSTLYKIADILMKHRRRYYSRGGDYIGIGGSAVSNSRKAVKEADAVIILYSESYEERYRDFPDTGAISAEIKEMMKRGHEVPIAVLSMEKYDLLADKLPWSDLGLDSGVPAVGTPLRGASVDVLQKSVSEAVKYIDDWPQSQSHRRATGKIAPKKRS